MIRIVPPADWHPLDEALRRLCAQETQPAAGHQAHAVMRPEPPYYSWLVFTSANGVNCFFERLYELGFSAPAIQGTRVAVIGTSTQSALVQHGLSADLVPDEFVAEGLVTALVEEAEKRGEKLAGKHVLLARATEGRITLLSGLQEAGAIVDDVAAYRILPVDGNDETGREILRMLRGGQIDMLTFTSSSTVRNFVQWLGGHAEEVTLGHAVIACIGPVTAQTARELGLQVQIEAKESTVDGLIEAILRYEEEL